MSQSSTYGLGGGGGGGVVTISGDTGSATGATITFDAYPGSGQSVFFHASGSTVALDITDSAGNTLLGLGAGDAGLSGTNNTSLGKESLNVVSTGSSNIAIGYQAMGATTTGSSNIVIGGGGANSSTLGSNNIIIGNPSAVPGAISNQTVIGNDTTAETFVSGIEGVDVGSVAKVVTVNSDQLGSATITAGSGITVVPGANTITISASSSGTTWYDVISGSATLAASSGYVINNAGATTLTLPTSASLGDTIQIVGRQGIWAIIYGVGQYIKFGTQDTTITSGQLSATDASDCVTLVCIIPSVTTPIFAVTSSIGNITVV